MTQVFNKTVLSVVMGTAILGLAGCATSGVNNDGVTKHVGNVQWTTQASTDTDAFLATDVPADETRLVFIRQLDNDPEQTDANIVINDRYQVSLHPGNYTAVNSCVGINRLSVQATGFKNNDLLANAQDFTLAGGETYFFYVDMDEAGNSSLERITEESGIQMLDDKTYQTHQISRVVPNCPAPAPAPTPVVVVPPPAQPEPVVLAAPVNIELEVLFDNDKSFVKPEYYSEVQEVADFMNEYPNTIATIEGHTDSNASDSYNLALSQRRVDAVRDILINEFSISGDRLRAVGYGESRPRATNATAEGRQQNRRVVAVVEERSAN